VPFDLSAYCRRLGVRAPARADLQALQLLHAAHVRAIPFENLDIQMGLPVHLDIDRLQVALVARRRGGYCFQQNTLFLHALRALGFDAVPCEARVRLGASTVLPRTHMLLLVREARRIWLCDGGFGGAGLLEPARLDGDPVVHGAWMHRVVHEEGLHVLQARAGDGWTDLYAFEAAERHPVDFEMGNWYTSTWPQSKFVLMLTAQRSTPDTRHVLRNLTYSEDHGGVVRTREIDRRALLPLLRDTFGLDVPDGARFRALDGPPSQEPPG